MFFKISVNLEPATREPKTLQPWRLEGTSPHNATEYLIHFARLSTDLSLVHDWTWKRANLCWNSSLFSVGINFSLNTCSHLNFLRAKNIIFSFPFCINHGREFCMEWQLFPERPKIRDNHSQDQFPCARVAHPTATCKVAKTRRQRQIFMFCWWGTESRYR